MLETHLKEVEAKIQAACDRAGRKREEVTLIAVSKTKPIEMLQEAYDLGVRVFGENKVQEITAKYDALPDDIHWHMIGHLQTNKVKYIIDKVDLIHSTTFLYSNGFPVYKVSATSEYLAIGPSMICGKNPRNNAVLQISVSAWMVPQYTSVI